MKILKRLCNYLAIMGIGILLAGCVTTEDPSLRMREREDLLVLHENLNRMEGRVETMEMEYRRLQQEIMSLKNNSYADTQQRSTQARLDAMEQRLTTLDAAREQDRKAIIEQISARVSDVMRGSGATQHSGKQAAGAAAGYGYEHEVRAGETLSAIAAAYKVSAKIIVEANDLKDPNHLRPGQKLFIPK